MPATYKEVAIQSGEEVLERLVALLSQLGFEGFWEDGDTLKCYVNDQRWSPTLRTEIEEVLQLVHSTSRSPLPALTVTTIENVDWNAQWEKTIRPIRVGRRIVIAPSWHPHTPEPGDLVLTIDPKMSFGTGYHESTRLILRLLENTVKTGDRVLDMDDICSEIGQQSPSHGRCRRMVGDERPGERTGEWCCRPAHNPERNSCKRPTRTIRSGYGEYSAYCSCAHNAHDGPTTLPFRTPAPFRTASRR